MLVLGLSGGFAPPDGDIVPGMVDWFFHDAAACLVEDGVLLAAVEEERLNRIKMTNKFPGNAIRACLDTAGVEPGRVEAVGYYFPRDFVDESLNELYVFNPRTPLGYARELVTDRLRTEFGVDVPEERIVYVKHHLAHATACFTRSGMDEALVATVDGRGERDSATIYHGRDGELTELATYDIPRSLGALYVHTIELLGYRIGDEYKVMGLAPYGDPRTYRHLFDSIFTLGPDGAYDVQPSTMNSHPVAATFYRAGFRPRRKGEKFTQQHMDLAAALQELLERAALHMLGHWAGVTGLRNLCFVGGVAHNSSLNGLLLRSGLFDRMFVHPASHDGGAAEGAALAGAWQLGSRWPRQPRMRTAAVGPALGDADQVASALRAWGRLVDVERPADVVDTAAHLLADGQVLGWAHGRSEFGPRALGFRSIVADARPAENKTRINAMVKKREGYRPFAPVVTPQDAADYFDLPATEANYDFMSYVVPVHDERRAELGAVTHVDGSARIQIVEADVNPRFHRLVTRFGELTGTPVLLNTSFNNNAEPIVQTIEDVLTSYLTTDLDALVIEDFVVRRRPDADQGLDSFVPHFRPTTRVAARTRITASGEREITHEIYLEYGVWGPQAQISPEMYAVLAAVDGRSSLRELAGGSLDDALRKELFGLWQERFFALRPPA
ncbi:carbamoyltransferase C-terminal domain-containing protein [Micromonospora sp. NPDC048999]|uniref:carbamoyltransferase family protein n=1 Tax=Micromonospora sp. NPDC048999 TaxID=3155391 RepID=UPI0033EAFDC0